MQGKTVLIVDDEADIRELLAMTLSRMDIESVCAATLTEAKALLKKQTYCLCLADMRLPDGDGIELVRYIQAHYAQLPVAVITAYGNVEGAVNTLKAGAFDYVSKPVDLKLLRGLVTTALKLSQGTGGTSPTAPEQLIGESACMQTLREKIAKVARSQAPVFISGDSGSGKELVARRIHQQSPRAEGPFVPVNCGAIPSELMESEFFGHKKGSFTGAHEAKQGLFQRAAGGTLFLDEIADLPLTMQVKLLRAIQEKAVRPIGETVETPTDVRIVSASHKNLKALITNGAFREDLYYRINVIELGVPSLSERPEDIVPLAQTILKKMTASHDGACPTLSEDCEHALKAYPFPGNVRELENILERAVTLCEGNQLTADDLHLPESTQTEEAGDLDLPLEDYLDEQAKAVIMQALAQNKWNRTKTAKALGMTFRQLRYRLKKLALD